MKNTLRRISALLVAAIMTIAMCIPVMATGTVTTPTAPSGADKAILTVKGVNAEDKDSAIVTAYRIVKPEFNADGLVGYTAEDGISIADKTYFRPTADEMTAIVTAVKANPDKYTKVVFTRDDTTGDYVSAAGAAGAGEYLVLITGATDKENTSVYNPALVSINYTDANDSTTITGTPVDMTGTFDIGSVAYVKRSEPELKKFIVENGEDKKATDVFAEGDNTQPGNVINFKITAGIPSYKSVPSVTEEVTDAGGVTTTKIVTKGIYENPIVRITDTLDDTFTAIIDANNGGIVVQNNGTPLKADEYTLDVNDDGKGFVIKLAKDYIFAHGNETITVLYSAKLQDVLAAQNFDENKNIVKYEYSNNPEDDNDVKELRDVTYNYTYSIDGRVGAEKIVVKHGDKEDEYKNSGEISTYEVEKGKLITTNRKWEEHEHILTTYGPFTTMYPEDALENAEFTLYKKYEENVVSDAVASTTSDAGGHLYFHGLDAGIYYLKETKAPTGYSLNNTVYKVVITATIDETSGVLKELKTEFFDAKSNAQKGSIVYKNTATKAEVEKVEIPEGEGTTTTVTYGNVYSNVTIDVDPLVIPNTPLAALPSTGGMGSYIFTIIGVAVMAVVAGSFFRSRAKA